MVHGVGKGVEYKKKKIIIKSTKDRWHKAFDKAEEFGVDSNTNDNNIWHIEYLLFSKTFVSALCFISFKSHSNSGATLYLLYAAQFMTRSTKPIRSLKYKK